MRVHQIRIDFWVTEQIKRYVYVYLLEGNHCYLIDSGVAGCQEQIINHMSRIGKDMTDLKGIFLTHAHPDHIGTAAWFKEQTGCKIYASEGEKEWIEDVDLQYEQRPIPNFYKIVGKSVKIDQIVKNGDVVSLDEAFSIKVVGTAGHSVDEVSYQLDDMMFIGDSVPIEGDIPIYIDADVSIHSLEIIRGMNNCKWFYPAWDITYDYAAVQEKVEAAITLIQGISHAVEVAKKSSDDTAEIIARVCDILHKPRLAQNPLFARTIRSYL